MVADGKPKKWELTGVPADLRGRVQRAAEARSMTATAWVQEALEAQLRREDERRRETAEVRSAIKDLQFDIGTLRSRLQEMDKLFDGRVRGVVGKMKGAQASLL